MNLDEYTASKHAYAKANPYGGDVSSYITPQDLMSGSADSMAANAPQDQWVDNNYQDWLGTMPQEQQAEYKRLAHEKYLSDRNKSRMAALAAFGGIAGAGMLGAGMLGSGAMGGAGSLGAAGGDLGMAGWMGAGAGEMGLAPGAAGLASSGGGMGALSAAGGDLGMAGWMGSGAGPMGLEAGTAGLAGSGGAMSGLGSWAEIAQKYGPEALKLLGGGGQGGNQQGGGLLGNLGNLGAAGAGILRKLLQQC